LRKEKKAHFALSIDKIPFLFFPSFGIITLSLFFINDLLFLHFVNQGHVVPHSIFLDVFRKREDHVIGFVRDDDVQWIFSVSTAPSAVVSLVVGAPVSNNWLTLTQSGFQFG